MEALQLRAHLHAQFGIEIRQRLVHQEDLRIADQRPSQRNALLLTAGKLPRVAIEQVLDAQDLRGPLHLGVELALAIFRICSGKARFLKTVLFG